MRGRYKQSMLVFGGVADDEALEMSTFFNDVCVRVITRCFVLFIHTLRMFVLKLERMQWHQVSPNLMRQSPVHKPDFPNKLYQY